MSYTDKDQEKAEALYPLRLNTIDNVSFNTIREAKQGAYLNACSHKNPEIEKKAIDFADWLTEKGWRKITNPHYPVREDIGKWYCNSDASQAHKTLSELYQLYNIQPKNE